MWAFLSSGLQSPSFRPADLYAISLNLQERPFHASKET